MVRHAYPAAGGGPVICEADIEGGTLEVVVADRGEGFRPSHSPGLGAGLAIIADACDELTIRRRDHEGVEVWMRFVIVPELAAPADDLWL